MRKDRFLERFAELLPGLRSKAKHEGLCYDDASEVVGKCAELMLKSKRYTIIEPEKLKAFLNIRISFAVKHFKEAEKRRTVDCARLPDPELSATADSTVTVADLATVEAVEDKECPFCFQANLNVYGACSLCHTIVPSHRTVQREVIVMSKESLAVEFDFDTKIDVEKAIGQLTLREQRVVRAIGLGNETLESFAEVDGSSRSTLSRDWVLAKGKLQELLYQYAPTGPSKRGQNAFRKALQHIDFTQ